MIFNIISAFIATTISMFLGLAIMLTIANATYDQLIARPNVTIKIVISLCVAIFYGTSILEILFLFIVALIGCFLGQELFRQLFK